MLDPSGAVALLLGISPVTHTVLDVGAGAPVVGISPAAVTVLGAGGATAPVVWIAPARTTPESAHARAIANAKRLIVCFSFEECQYTGKKTA